MNTKHAHTVYLWVFLLQAAHKIALSCWKSICKYIFVYVVSTFVIKLLRKLVVIIFVAVFNSHSITWFTFIKYKF